MARALVLLAVAVALCAAAPSPSNAGTLLEVAQSLPDFSTLVAVAAKAGLAPLLSAPGFKTVFAPTNEAFGALGNNTLAWITNDRNQQHLLTTLYYHFTTGAVKTTNLRRISTLTTFDQTLEGPESVRVSSSGSDVRINNAKIIIADVEASNGVIQAIDRVLVPANIGLPARDIVGTAEATAALSTLVKAVVAAGLAGALSQPNGPYTVFAPLDSAFAAVPTKVINCLLSNPTALGKVLLGHVVKGLVYSSDIPQGAVVTTLSGLQLTLGVTGNTVTVNYGASFPTSNVVLPDVDTSNGAVHVIDKVIFDNSGPCAQL